MDGPAAPCKRPWELHAILCVFLIALGAAFSLGTFRPENPRIEHLIAIGGMTFSLIGLFRGSRVAWWASLAAFAILTVAMIWEMARLLLQYGFIAHRKLLLAYGEAASCSAVFGLLLGLRLRGALPPHAEPLVADLPAFHAILKIFAPIIFFLAAVFSLATPLLFDTGRSHGERVASTCLKTIASAEADFRANDRDWNHFNDFWTGDVAGLYGIVPPRTDDKEKQHYQRWGMRPMDSDGVTPVKLIELSVALADGHPIPNFYPPVNVTYGTSAPRAGTWFAALRADRSVTPPETYGVRNTSRFGFIAYPEDFIAARYVFIVNENNTIFRQKLDRDIRLNMKSPPGPPVEAFRDWPSDDDLKARWAKLD